MPDWEQAYGWMAFRSLDACEGLTRCFTIGYRITGDDTDDWSARFDRFKGGYTAAIRGGKSMMQVAVPHLVSGLGLDASRTVFIPALSSGETVASERGVLSGLARACAKAANAGFVADAISKKVHDPLHRAGSAGERRQILDTAEYKSRKMNASNVLIFDDFITRGDTLSHVAQAIHEHRENRNIKVYGVALAKTERTGFLPGGVGSDAPNDHVPAKWLALWEDGEAQ